MTLEHRLQHAARELREVHIDVPPLGVARTAPRRSRLATVGAPLLVPMMFVIGALFAIGATHGAVTQPTVSDIPVVQPGVDSPSPPTPDPVNVSDDADASERSAASAPSAPSALAEREMIAELLSRQRVDAAAESPTTDSSAILRRDGRLVGPI